MTPCKGSKIPHFFHAKWSCIFYHLWLCETYNRSSEIFIMYMKIQNEWMFAMLISTPFFPLMYFSSFFCMKPVQWNSLMGLSVNMISLSIFILELSICKLNLFLLFFSKIYMYMQCHPTMQVTSAYGIYLPFLGYMKFYGMENKYLS